MLTPDELDAIEALADRGDLGAAVARAEALRAGLRGGPEAARLGVLIASLTARQGDLEGALPQLEVAHALARSSGVPEVAAEAQVTRASVLAALGDYDRALPLLRATIAELRQLPGAEELLADAQVELASYQTLLGQSRS